MARDKTYNYSAEQLKLWIDEYFQYLSDNPKVKGSKNGLLKAMHMTDSIAEQITKDRSWRYKKEAELMREAAIRLREHLETSPAWAGQSAAKSMFLLKQPLWDGLAYADRQEVKTTGNASLTVKFGAGKGDKGAFD